MPSDRSWWPVISIRFLSLALAAVSLLLVCRRLLARRGGSTRRESARPGTSSRRVVALGVVCTALAFVAFFELIKEIGSTRATIITYLNPAVAVALGVVVLEESSSNWELASGSCSSWPGRGCRPPPGQIAQEGQVPAGQQCQAECPEKFLGDRPAGEAPARRGWRGAGLSYCGGRSGTVVPRRRRRHLARRERTIGCECS